MLPGDQLPLAMSWQARPLNYCRAWRSRKTFCGISLSPPLHLFLPSSWLEILSQVRPSGPLASDVSSAPDFTCVGGDEWLGQPGKECAHIFPLLSKYLRLIFGVYMKILQLLGNNCIQLFTCGCHYVVGWLVLHSCVLLSQHIAFRCPRIIDAKIILLILILAIGGVVYAWMYISFHLFTSLPVGISFEWGKRGEKSEEWLEVWVEWIVSWQSLSWCP